MVAAFFKRFTYGFRFAAEKSYSFLIFIVPVWLRLFGSGTSCRNHSDPLVGRAEAFHLQVCAPCRAHQQRVHLLAPQQCIHYRSTLFFCSSQSLRNPDFNQRLSWNTKTVRFKIQAGNHPRWKIDINPLGFVPWPNGLGQIEIRKNIFFSFVKNLVQLFSCHNMFSLRFLGLASRK